MCVRVCLRARAQWDKTAEAIASIPFVPGHEAVGVVAALGPAVKHLKVGDRVGCENHFYCGTCYQCTHNEPHICQRMAQLGHGRGTTQGGCSQYAVMREPYCYRLQTDIDDETACLLEPFGVGHHACEAAEVRVCVGVCARSCVRVCAVARDARACALASARV